MSTTLLASDIFYMKNENFTLPTHPYIKRKAFRRRSDVRFQARRQRSCRGAVFLRCYDVRIDAHFALTMGAQGHSEELRGVANGTGRITCGRTVAQCFSSCASSLPRRAASWPFPPSLRFRNAFAALATGQWPWFPLRNSAQPWIAAEGGDAKISRAAGRDPRFFSGLLRDRGRDQECRSSDSRG